MSEPDAPWADQRVADLLAAERGAPAPDPAAASRVAARLSATLGLPPLLPGGGGPGGAPPSSGGPGTPGPLGGGAGAGGGTAAGGAGAGSATTGAGAGLTGAAAGGAATAAGSTGVAGGAAAWLVFGKLAAGVAVVALAGWGAQALLERPSDPIEAAPTLAGPRADGRPSERQPGPAITGSRRSAAPRPVAPGAALAATPAAVMPERAPGTPTLTVTPSLRTASSRQAAVRPRKEGGRETSGIADPAPARLEGAWRRASPRVAGGRPRVALRPRSPVHLPAATGEQRSIRGRAPSAGSEGLDVRADARLSAERQLLDRARGALRGGDPQAALGHLSDHARSFPEARLAEERLALEVVALARAGRHEHARSRAATFRRGYPNSLLTSTVTQAVARPAQ